METAMIKVMPIILLVVVGKFLDHKKWISNITLSEIKKGVINIALPVILFTTFKNMILKPEYFVISLVSFVMLSIFYIVGGLIKKICHIEDALIPFFSSAFAFGLLGIPLFEGVYGTENLTELSILGIGNEFFTWFVYMPMFQHQFGHKKFSADTIRGFLKSPIILAIIAGLVFNIFKLDRILHDSVIYSGFLRTIGYIAPLTTPLILLAIGAGLKFDKEYLVKSFRYVVIRLCVILGVGYLVRFFVIDQISDMTRLFDKAFFTFLILPPPFALALFVGQYSSEEKTAVVNNATVISTVVSIVLFIAMVIITG